MYDQLLRLMFFGDRVYECLSDCLHVHTLA